MTYPEMKDSGIPWIGEIPRNWKAPRLKWILSNPLQYGANELGLPYNESLPRYIRITDITLDGRLKATSMQSLSEEVAENYILDDEDILLARSGATVGKAFFYKIQYGKAAFAGYLIRAKINAKMALPKFVYYSMLSGGYEQWKDITLTQATIQNISANRYNDFALALPSVDVQNAIVSYLDNWCGTIDSIIDEAKASIEEYKRWKASVIYQAVTKGIDPDAPMKDSGLLWIGKVPSHWGVDKAKYHVVITNGSDPDTEGDIPVYGSGAGSFKTCGEYKEGPAVLIGRKGATLHIPHFIEGRYWNADTAFDVKAKQGYSLRYFYYSACCFDYKYYISQTTLPSMTQSNYANMKVPVPPMQEQNDIVEFLDAQCKEIDSVISEKQSLISELEAYKSLFSILPRGLKHGII